MGHKDFRKYASLLEEARKGNSQAFRELYRETSKSQLYHLRTHINEPEALKDALQEVYILLYQNMDKINPPTVVVAYLNRLTYFVGKNTARKLSRYSSHLTEFEWLDEIEEPEAQERLNQIEHSEQQKLILNTIDKLPPKERSAIYMRFYQNLRHQDVALSLGISEASAKRLQRSAQVHLRELLIKEGISGVSIFIPGYLGKLIQRSEPLPPNKPSCHSCTPGSASGSSSFAANLAAAGLSLAVICGGSLSGSPTITSITVPQKPVKAPAKIEIQVASSFPVMQVRLTDKEGRKIYGERTAKNTYHAYISHNGQYQVDIISNNGQKNTGQANVTTIDSGHPEVTCRAEDDKLYVSMMDDESGIDYDSLYCQGVKSNEIIHPRKIDYKEGLAIFSLPHEEVVIHLKDNAGNEGKIPIAYQGK